MLLFRQCRVCVFKVTIIPAFKTEKKNKLDNTFNRNL